MAPVQPEASVVATGLGIRYIGDYAYAYSGLVSMDNIHTLMLSGTTGSGIILAEFQYHNLQQVSLAWSFRIQLNDLEVANSFWTTGHDFNGGGASDVVKLILPPRTKFELHGKNSESTASKNWAATMTGRVYGAE